MIFDPARAEAGLLRTAGMGPGPALGGVELSVVGIGWATVELDRAATELGVTPGYEVESARPDTLLGATARIGRPGGGGPVAVLLEPFTEGRLAAFLARHGEAPAALYLAPRAGGLDAAVDRLAAAGIRTRAGSGPFGPAALVLGRSAGGPQVVLVAVPSDP
ncbi:MAG: VOC family protein [Chloroflexota bacterium]|nr:VOC family protein [Chloroflexota bacterium]